MNGANAQWNGSMTTTATDASHSCETLKSCSSARRDGGVRGPAPAPLPAPRAFATRSTALAGAVAVVMMIAAGSSAAASEHRYTYRVDDSTYGEVGTYSNDVEIIGDTKTVTTEAHIKVSLLGIALYNQDASRIERWVDDRLLYFHGVTTENGRPTEINGYADADHFIVISALGKIAAPATIRPANPWIAGTPGGDTLLMPDTGLIEKVQANACEDATITIDGSPKPTRRCEVDAAEERYNVWIDHSGTPLMFTIRDHATTVTFTLVR
jgi:hypothetical protein